ncbi:MAG TPA: hypothetical protein VNW50_21635, partial [Streptosporangiaceae bacterium]|nr:hypothetical protein [Streptosporangiaceae bacterium]
MNQGRAGSGGRPSGSPRTAGSGGRPAGTPGTRAKQLGDRIAEIVAEMLERRIKDPRLGFVTV